MVSVYCILHFHPVSLPPMQGWVYIYCTIVYILSSSGMMLPTCICLLYALWFAGWLLPRDFFISMVLNVFSSGMVLPLVVVDSFASEVQHLPLRLRIHVTITICAITTAPPPIPTVHPIIKGK